MAVPEFDQTPKTLAQACTIVNFIGNCLPDFATKENVPHVFRSDEWKWDVLESTGNTPG